MGSGSTSALSRPALVYSLRRFEASTVYLPAPGAGGALERADYVGGDPTPVEVPLLRLDPLPVHPAGVHPRRVERHVVLELPVRREGVGVAPGDPPLATLIGEDDVEVARPALPLAERGPVRGREVLHADVLWREVVDGRVAGLEHPLGARSVGEGGPAE